MLTAQQNVNKDEYSADGDGGISDIEGRPRIESLPRQKMKINLEKIGYGSVKDAIGEVAGGPAEEKSQTGGICAADAATGDKKPGNKSNDDERTGNKDDAESGRGKGSKKTEGNPRVAGIHEVKEIFNNGLRETTGRAGFDPGLGKAVEEYHRQGQPKEAKAGRESHGVKRVTEPKKSTDGV